MSVAGFPFDGSKQYEVIGVDGFLLLIDFCVYHFGSAVLPNAHIPLQLSLQYVLDGVEHDSIFVITMELTNLSD